MFSLTPLIPKKAPRECLAASPATVSPVCEFSLNNMETNDEEMKPSPR